MYYRIFSQCQVLNANFQDIRTDYKLNKFNLHHYKAASCSFLKHTFFWDTLYHHNAHHLNGRRMFHWTEDEYARLTTFTSLLSVFSSLVLLPILRSDISSFGKHIVDFWEVF